MLLLRRIIQKKINAQGNLTREDLVKFFSRVSYRPIDEGAVRGYRHYCEVDNFFPVVAEQLADECLRVTEGASEDIPRYSGEPLLTPLNNPFTLHEN